MSVPTVRIVTSDGALRRALRAHLEHAAQFRFLDHHPSDRDGRPADVVVTPVSDCPSERCVELAAEGTRVIILAAIPRESERDRYLEAGAAAYVAMTVGGDQLIGEIRRVLGQPPDGA